ncbi:MAG: P-loop NTPase [Actinomycetales bacterium]|nr:P-loop NTPase [Actinomycetales bacterium]
MHVAVASGKGGTGKTLVATNLAVHLQRTGRRVTLVDCDVDAPNAALFLDAPLSATPVTVAVPVVPPEGACPDSCTACRDACPFGALRVLGGRPVVFADLCHHCGLCTTACPAGVLRMQPVEVGRVHAGRTGDGLRLVVGTLEVGLTEAPAVVRAARRLGVSEASDVVVLDAPPGAACAVVATLHRADLAVLVTDATAFGLHDLRLMVELCREMEVPAVVALNRAGLGDVDVPAWCREEDLPLVGHLPFDRRVAACYADGALLLDAFPPARLWFAEIAAAVERHGASRGAEVPA